MMNLRMRGLVVVLGVTALMAAACGSGAADGIDESIDAVDGSGAQATGQANVEPIDTGTLPLADGDQQGDVAVAGLCAPGEPDCTDTAVDDSEVLDLETGEEAGIVDGELESSSSLGLVIDGGLTISDALTTDATGVLAVKGHFYDDGSGPVLCERLIGLGERYGCDGERIVVTDLDTSSIADSLVFHDGLTYTEELLTVFGEMVDGALVINNLISG